MTESTIVTGFVKFFNSDKGYGFIWPESEMSKPDSVPVSDGGREDVFFHATSIMGENGFESGFGTGDKVQFEVADGDQGAIAVNIVRIEAARVKKKRPFMVPTVLMIGVRKTDATHLMDIFKDFLDEKNIHHFSEQEVEAMRNAHRLIADAHDRAVRKVETVHVHKRVKP